MPGIGLKASILPLKVHSAVGKSRGLLSAWILF